MARRIALITLVAWLSPFSAAAQTKAVTPPPPIVRVALTTSVGVITLDLEAKRAAVTTANFLRYVDQKRFDGTVFYRAMKLDWSTGPAGLIQGGTQNDPKRVLKPIAHEPTSLTGLHHDKGAISMARFAPGTATGDFSIMIADMRGLDADPANKDDPAGYAVFGKVTEGMEIVTKIYNSPTSTTLGQGFMRGQMIAAPVKIITARRVALRAPAQGIAPQPVSPPKPLPRATLPAPAS